MNTSPLAAIQAAIFSRLDSDTALSTLVTGVFDYVPENAAFPYVTLGEAIESPDNTHDSFGSDVLETIDVWSKSRGYSEPLAVANRIVELLDHQPLSVTGHTAIAVRLEMLQPMRDSDPTIRRVVLRFRVATEKE